MRHKNEDIELSRPLQVDRVSMGGVREKIVASPDERVALAKRFGLMNLTRLEATIDVDHAQGKMFEVKGRFFADVVQECVVTLEPIEAHISDGIDLLFAPPHIVKKHWDGALGDLGDAEPPEPIENGVIDLGELVSQHLALALDPYPRKEGVGLEPFEILIKPEQPVAEKTNPFAKLVDLKDKK